MTAQTKGVDVLATFRRDAELALNWNGRAKEESREAFRESQAAIAAIAALIEASRELSADLEHSIGLANFGASGTVRDDHPIRLALNRMDAALARVGGAQ